MVHILLSEELIRTALWIVMNGGKNDMGFFGKTRHSGILVRPRHSLGSFFTRGGDNDYLIMGSNSRQTHAQFFQG